MSNIARRHHSEEIWVLEFTAESAEEFRQHLLKSAQRDPNKPVIIYIDSYGGQVDALAKMVATMDEVENPIITACIGKAMSCGAILLSHGDMRFCDPHSRVMIHKVQGYAAGDVEDIQNDATEITRLNRYWLDFLADNCHIKGGYTELERLLKSKDGRDRYMTAQEAVKLGLVDVVGVPQVSIVLQYEVTNGPKKMPIKKRAELRTKHKADRVPGTLKKKGKTNERPKRTANNPKRRNSRS
jgi:ATP-dependent Clp endopeptidase proteolytic subunit ClpP